MIEQIRSAIERNFERQSEWLSRLVRFQSRREEEQACQEWIAAECRSRGWDVDVFSLADVEIEHLPGFSPMPGVDRSKSIQVIATPPSARSSEHRSLILQGHVDVVPEGPRDMWSRDPFSGEIADGWLHGRGAQDMKTGISALVFALDAIADAGLMPAAPVYFQTVTEEESTGNGALATLARGCRADACLIPEPTSNTITRAQTGAIWFRLRVSGRPVHVARAQSGSNAILSAMGLVESLEALTERLNRQANSDKWFGSVDQPIKFNPGVIRGGDWPSSTPSWCEVECRLGVLPGMSLADVRQEIVSAVEAAAAEDPFLVSTPPAIIWNGFQAEGAVLIPGGDAETTLRGAHCAVFGTEMEERLSTAVNDTRFYSLYYGIPSLCYGPAGKGMHSFDERANLANLKQTTMVIAQFIGDWCGLRPR